MGVLVGAVQRQDSLAVPLTFVGVVFVLLQVLSPIHQAVGANLGDRTAAWLYDRLTEACVRPPGMGHLEDPKLTSDLTVARDFDLGMTGPPLSISMDFIAGGLVEMIGGLASAVVLVRATPGGRRSCSPAPGWRRTGCCARARSGATATPTRCARAQRDADYAYRLAVDPPAARSCGCSAWPAGRSTASSPAARACTSCSTQATRLREQPVLWSLLLVVGANVARVLVARPTPPPSGRLDARRSSSSSRRARSARR